MMSKVWICKRKGVPLLNLKIWDDTVCMSIFTVRRIALERILLKTKKAVPLHSS